MEFAEISPARKKKWGFDFRQKAEKKRLRLSTESLERCYQNTWYFSIIFRGRWEREKESLLIILDCVLYIHTALEVVAARKPLLNAPVPDILLCNKEICRSLKRGGKHEWKVVVQHLLEKLFFVLNSTFGAHYISTTIHLLWHAWETLFGPYHCQNLLSLTLLAFVRCHYINTVGHTLGITGFFVHFFTDLYVIILQHFFKAFWLLLLNQINLIFKL